MSTTTGEDRVLAVCRMATPLTIIVHLCNEYQVRYGYAPNMIGINQLLQKDIEESLYHCNVNPLPIPSEAITWFYHDERMHQADRQFVMMWYHGRNGVCAL